MVDREGDTGPVQRHSIEELVHVLDGVDGHADASDLPFGQLVVRVVAGQGGVVEVRAQAGLAVGEKEAEPFVGGAGRPETGDLPARPRPGSIHRGVGAPGERVGPRKAHARRVVLFLDVGGGVEALYLDAGEGAELLASLRGPGHGVSPLAVLPLTSELDNPVDRVPA